MKVETLNDDKGHPSSMRLALIIISIGVLWIYVLVSIYVLRFIALGEHPDWVGLGAFLGGPAILGIGSFAAKAWQKKWEVAADAMYEDEELTDDQIQQGQELINKIKAGKEDLPVVKGFKP